jgi:hypothetical protein
VPGQHRPARGGIKGKSPRTPALPEPGIGGYDYPRGPMGKTGFPGSTPASKRTHTQGRDGRKDRAATQQPITVQQREYYDLPAHRPGGDPSQPRARQMRSTAPERRMVPVSEHAPGSQNVRNTIAQRYKAVPGQVRAYRASPNPGKTGARLDGASRYHPDIYVHGHPDGKPVPGMASQPGYPPMVVVSSRYVSREGGQEGYAVDRPMLFAKGGTPPRQPHGAAPHIRGGRMSGQRYFGALADQQRIGLDSDAYGISRRRGPRHRPMRFEVPSPHAANYYDVPPHDGTEAPDMIHRSPAATSRPKRRGSARQNAQTPRMRRGQ